MLVIFNKIWLKFNIPLPGKAAQYCYLFSKQNEKQAQSIKVSFTKQDKKQLISDQPFRTFCYNETDFLFSVRCKAK